MPTRKALLDAIASELHAIRHDLIAREADVAELLNAVHTDNLRSARNLVHYVALRRNDIRDLQQRLSSVGLSSLSGCEPHVLGTIDSIIALLNLAAGARVRDTNSEPVGFGEGRDGKERPRGRARVQPRLQDPR